MNILRCFKEVNKDLAEEYHTIDFKEFRGWWVNFFKNVLFIALLLGVLIITSGIGFTISRSLGFQQEDFLDLVIVLSSIGVGLLIDLYIFMLSLKCEELKEGK